MIQFCCFKISFFCFTSHLNVSFLHQKKEQKRELQSAIQAKPFNIPFNAVVSTTTKHCFSEQQTNKKQVAVGSTTWSFFKLCCCSIICFKMFCSAKKYLRSFQRFRNCNLQLMGKVYFLVLQEE